MNKNMYKFVVKYADTDDNYKEITERGLLIAEKYTEAVEQLIEYFGEDEIVSFSIEYVTDHSVIVVSTEEAINDIVEGNFW